jgi:subtilisin family serine protease
MKNAIADCARNGRGGRGCVICFAAGNSNHDINNPPLTLDGFAIHPDVIAVAASTSVDTKANYSSFGDEVSVCAPSSGAGGRGVLTADVRGQYSYQGNQYFSGYAPSEFTKYNTTYLFGGTSSSCPLVAGICALMLSVDPSLTSIEVKQILETTARKIGDPNSYVNGHSIYFGYGCINAEAAIDAVLVRNETKNIT